MAINAFKNGVTVIDEENMNQILCCQDFSFIFEGTQRDYKTGSGVTENSIANYNYCLRFTMTSATILGRIELHIDKDGSGADLVVEIRSGMNPASGVDGTLLKTMVFPKEFINTSAGYVSIPILLTGLTAGNTYWIKINKAGDATNKIDLVGEASTDGSYPAYYRDGDSGNWTANNAIHFKVFDNTPGPTIKHSIYGTNQVSSFTYDANGLVTSITRYLPPSDMTDGGIRETITINTSGGYITGGDVS